jgi:hypothetical protein
VTVAELQPGYEEVFTVMDYYDGPRKGFANFRGQPHFYDCIFDDDKDEYSDLYHLTPISQRVFELAKEDWPFGKTGSRPSIQEKQHSNLIRHSRRTEGVMRRFGRLSIRH